MSRENAQHYVWGQVCDGWHLVQRPELSVIEERMPPEEREERHRHRRARQFFYVLEGELTLDVEGERFIVRQNCGMEIAPGVAHQAFNLSAGDVRFLVISQPASHGDRILAG